AAEVAVEVAPIAAEATEPAEGAEPLYYANGPCGRTPTLWKYFYGYAPARNLHDCNKRALEESRRTGLWLFSAWRNSTGECCLFLQPNSRH
ncbi:MAG: hypothetical protein KC635_01340, partial [Myxococcales bacterium]|nr:hypothetical protein [Myxococcales bacterium]